MPAAGEVLWARHVALEGFGLEGLRRTRAARVLWCSGADAAPAALYLHAAGIGTLRCEGEPGALLGAVGGVWRAPDGGEAFDVAGGVGDMQRFAWAVRAWRRGLPVAWAGAWSGGTWAGWFQRGARCPACQGGGDAARGAAAVGPFPPPAVRRAGRLQVGALTGPMAWAAGCRVAAWLLMAAAGVRSPVPGRVVRFDEAGARVQVVEGGRARADCPVCEGK